MASPLGLAQLIAMQGAASGQPAKMTGIQPTNVQQAYSDYNNAAMQAYAAQLGQQNALWGGLAGLGSSGILALGLGSKLGSAAPAAASAAAPAATTAASAAIPTGTELSYAAGAPTMIGGVGTDALGAGTAAGLGDAATTAAATGGGTDLLTAILSGLALL